MSFLTAIYNFMKTHTTSTVAGMTAVVFLVQSVLQPVDMVLPKVIGLIGVAFPAVAGIALTSYSFVDTFVPLTELAVLVGVWLPIFALVTFIRIIKSLIPFIS